MKVIEQVLTDAYVLKTDFYSDDRGYFSESFSKSKFETICGEQINFVQDNISKSSKGVLRGFHFQKGEYAQSKLVKVVKGRVFDVAVDLRPYSKTFMKWHGVELSEDNHLQFFIPKGFAHAFLSLEDNTIFEYKVDNYYSKENEGGFIWSDNQLSVIWPLKKYIISEKDLRLPTLNSLLNNSK